MRRRRSVSVLAVGSLLATLIGPVPAAAAGIATTITLEISPDQLWTNEPVTVTATVTPNPGSGVVSFQLCDVPTDVPLDPSDGSAEVTGTCDEVGVGTITAFYSGNATHGSSLEDETVAFWQRTTTTLEFGDFLASGEVEATVSVSPVPPLGGIGIRAADGTVVFQTEVFDRTDGEHTFALTTPFAGAGGPYAAFYAGSVHWEASESDPVAWIDTRRTTHVTFDSTLTAGAPYDPYQLTIDVDDEPEGLLIDGIVTIWSQLGDSSSLHRMLEATPSGNGIHVSDWLVSVAPTRTIWVEYSGSQTLQSSRSDEIVITSAKIPVTTSVELAETSIGGGESVEATVQVTPAPGNAPPDPIARMQLTSDADDVVTLFVPIDPDTGIGSVTINADDLLPDVWSVTAEFAWITPHSLRFEYDKSDPVELRREPVGPRIEVTGSPVPAYVGDPLTITATLDEVPSGGTVQLLGGPQWDQITTALGTKPIGGAAGASASFTVTATQGWLYRAVFSGTAESPPSRSGRFQPVLGQEPNTSLSNPGTWIHDSSPTFTWTATVTAGAGPAISECAVDEGDWFDCASPYTTPTLSDGPHTFLVRSTDANGKVETTPASRTFSLDTAAPVVTAFVANGGRPVNATTVPLELTASDFSLGRHGGYWQLLLSNSGAVDGDGRLINPGGWFTVTPSTSSPTLTRSWNFTNPSTGGTSGEGLHTVYAQVADAFGQWSDIESVTFRYDATRPGLTVDLADGAAVINSTTVKVSLCCIGADPSGIDQVRISNAPALSNGGLSQAKTFSAGSAFVWSLTDPAYGGPGPIEPGIAAGPFSVYVQWRDRAGNWSDVATDSVWIELPDPTPFDDVGTGDKFAADIAWAYHAGITVGCGAGDFCPDGLVTRAQMASFLSRALGLPPSSVDYFTDDQGSPHEGSINRIRAAGVTFGCGGTRFCPDGLVTRAQMASFLVRAYDLPMTGSDFFTDDEGNRHEASINRLRAAGVTYGCATTRFCPDGLVTRAQMAAFLHRAMTD